MMRSANYFDSQGLYIPHNQMPSPLQNELVSQFQQYTNPTFGNGAWDHNFLQSHGQPPVAQPNHYSLDAYQSYGDFLCSLLDVNQANSLQFPYNVSQEITNSIIPPSQPLERNAVALNILKTSEASNKASSSSVERNPGSISNLKRKQAVETSDHRSYSGESSNGSNQNTSNECKRTCKEIGESSGYRGVSRYPDRYEAYLWDNTDNTRKPRTVYIGGYNDGVSAARAHDLAALKLWGNSALLNFPMSYYKKELEEMQFCTKSEYLRNIRRRSRGFSKGASVYRGVSRNSDFKKWQARIGKGKGVRGIYLGTYDNEEEAARVYDVAAIRLKGENAITNFDLNEYDVARITRSATLPIGKGASQQLLKSSMDQVPQKKRNDIAAGKIPIIDLEEDDDLGSPDPELLAIFQRLEKLVAPGERSMQHQQNLHHSNEDLNQILNPTSPPLGFQNPFQLQTNPAMSHGFNSFGWDMSTDGNSSLNFNVDLDGLLTNYEPCQNYGIATQGIDQEMQPLNQFPQNLAVPENPQSTNQALYQNSSFSFNVDYDGLLTISEPVQNYNIAELEQGVHQEMQPLNRFPKNLAAPDNQQSTNLQALHQNSSFSILHGYQNPVEFQEYQTGYNGGMFKTSGVIEGSSAMATAFDITTELASGRDQQKEMQLCDNFQSLLTLQGQDNWNQSDDVLTIQQLHDQIPINFQVSGGYNNKQVSGDGIFEELPSLTESSDDANFSDSTGAAVVVENQVPAENGVNLVYEFDELLSKFLA